MEQFGGVVEGQSLPWHEKQLARCLRAGHSARRAVLVGVSAARVHGLWVLPPRCGEEPVTLALRSGVMPPRRDWGHGRSYKKMRLPDSMVEKVQGVRVTSALRAALDLARFEGWIRGFVALESWFRMHPELDVEAAKAMAMDCLATMGRVKDIAEARRAISLLSGQCESPYEALCIALLAHAKMGHSIQQQVWVIPSVRVDVLIDGWLVLEIDGAVKYDGATYDSDTRRVIVEERRREVRLQNAGYTVFRVTSTELFHQPQKFLAELRATWVSGRERGLQQVVRQA